ncbi:MAG TPA: transglycosylase SLT domain-containing protein [Bryobacteraceae bacterium]|nr:transglycosylase SLT domain-containing protein [Bryobacteraceae bacterium]
MTTRPGWETNIPGPWCRAAIAACLATAAFGQSPESPGRSYRDSPTPARRKALEKFAASHKDTGGALAHLTLGVVSYEQKQYTDAIRHLAAAQARLPKLADYTAYYLAASRLETQDYAAAASDAAAIGTASPRSPFAAKSVVLQARGLTGSGSAAAAIGMLREHYSDLPQPDGDLTLAAAYQAAHDLPHAAEYFQRVYYQYPSGDQAIESAAALVILRDGMGASYPAPSPQAMIERGNRLLAQREYQRARSEYESLASQLSGAERDRARVGKGAADYLDGEVSRAYSYLRPLEVSDAEADAERLYYLAECARRLNDDEQMMEAVRNLGKHHADSPWRYKALGAAANRFLVTNQPDKYVPLYQAAYETFPDQAQAAQYHWRVTWAAYIRRQHKGAELLREHLQKYPGHPSASAALYFLGRLAEAGGDYATARSYYAKLAAQFPNYYYGILARERATQPPVVAAGLSVKTAEFLRSIAFPPHRPAVASQPDAETSMRVARAHLLISAGLADLAKAELRFGARTGSQPYLLAMELARIANAPHEQLHSIKSAAPDYLALTLEDAPPAFWQLLFPLPYQKDLVRSAKQQNLDPYMVAALIRQESEFDPQALSPRHAYGLTQVEPATGRALARRAGVGGFTNRALFQPAVNLKIGTYYLRTLLDQWGGKWEQTLASYNAGKSRVNEWATWNQYQEPAEFVESIPFSETREYVQAVLRNATVYRQIYGNKPEQSRSAQQPRAHRRG